MRIRQRQQWPLVRRLWGWLQVTAPREVPARWYVPLALRWRRARHATAQPVTAVHQHKHSRVVYSPRFEFHQHMLMQMRAPETAVWIEDARAHLRRPIGACSSRLLQTRTASRASIAASRGFGANRPTHVKNLWNMELTSRESIATLRGAETHHPEHVKNLLNRELASRSGVRGAPSSVIAALKPVPTGVRRAAMMEGRLATSLRKSQALALEREKAASTLALPRSSRMRTLRNRMQFADASIELSRMTRALPAARRVRSHSAAVGIPAEDIHLSTARVPAPIIWSRKVRTEANLAEAPATENATHRLGTGSHNANAGGSTSQARADSSAVSTTRAGAIAGLDTAAVDRLADVVMRRIERHMRIERERRGL